MPPKPLDLYTAEAIIRIALACYHMTYVSWALALTFRTMQHGSPVTPELYGPLVYAIPAFVWFAAQMLSSIICVIGAWFGGRWGMRIVIVGGAAQSIVFGFFAKAAGDASLGVIVQTGSLYHAVPLSLFTIGAAIFVEGLRDEQR